MVWHRGQTMNKSDVRPSTVLVMAGGTGGHVFPALAVSHVLRDRGWHVEWLGTAQGIESRVVPEQDIPLHTISAVGLRGKGLAKLLVAPLHLARAFWQTVMVFRRTRPAVVLGMGGFVTGPGGLCARLLGVPLVIHEQNAIAGTANRILSRIAGHRLSAFPGVFAGGEYVGNPVRKPIAALALQPRTAMPAGRPARLLVLGGSLGARAINNLVPEALALLPDGVRPEVFHQAGRALCEETQAGYQQWNVAAEVLPFIDDMEKMYQWADMAICRSGAMTVSELACAQLPALLIPFPFAIDDHQTHNARWLVEAGGAKLLPQSGLTAQALADAIRQCLEHPDQLQSMSAALQQLSHPEAAEAVATICEQAASGERMGRDV